MLRMEDKSPGDEKGSGPKQQPGMPWDGKSETEKSVEVLIVLLVISLATYL